MCYQRCRYEGFSGECTLPMHKLKVLCPELEEENDSRTDNSNLDIDYDEDSREYNKEWVLDTVHEEIDKT